jgi:hypothetical protein
MRPTLKDCPQFLTNQHCDITFYSLGVEGSLEVRNGSCGLALRAKS